MFHAESAGVYKTEVVSHALFHRPGIVLRQRLHFIERSPILDHMHFGTADSPTYQKLSENGRDTDNGIRLAQEFLFKSLKVCTTRPAQQGRFLLKNKSCCCAVHVLKPEHEPCLMITSCAQKNCLRIQRHVRGYHNIRPKPCHSVRNHTSVLKICLSPR